MRKKGTFTLIRGTFPPVDAKEILIKLISNKIHFHQMKNFSEQERFGKPDKRSEKRILELKKSEERIREIIENAQRKGYLLKIDSSIKISLEK